MTSSLARRFRRDASSIPLVLRVCRSLAAIGTMGLVVGLLCAGPAEARRPRRGGARPKTTTPAAPPPEISEEEAQPPREEIPAATVAPKTAGAVSAGPVDGFTLSEAYQLALKRSEAVRLAEAASRSAEVRLRGVWTQIGPRIDAVASALAQNEVPIRVQTLPLDPVTRVVQTNQPVNERITYFRRGEQIAVGGAITQPLFRATLFPERRAARLGTEVAQASLARIREDLMFDVTASFIAVHRARQLVDTSKEAVQRAQVQLTSTRARIRAGGGLRTAELLASIDLQRSQIRQLQAEQTVRTESVTFERLMGIAPPAALAHPPLPVIPSLDGFLKKERPARNDLRALKLRTAEEKASERALKFRLFWPTLDAVGSAVYSYPAGLAALTWNVSGVLTIPLFQTGNEWIQVRLQHVRAEEAALRESQRAKEIRQEVQQAAIRLDTARQTVLLSQQQVQTAQQNYDLVATQFKLGATTFLEVDNAQTALTEAENQHIVALYERELANYALLYALGELKI